VEAPRLIEAVKLVAAGEGVLAPQVTRKLITAFAQTAGKPAAAPAGLGDLTDREREVLGCLGAGLSNAQIATRLRIGETTVKTHVSRVLTKLDLRSRVQAAILAQENGLTGE
jgi:DNA-binding NarL/FixJ family response regulator